MPVPSILSQPVPLSIIASQYWDLNAIPRARAFEVLAYNCDNAMEKDRLMEFSGFEGQQELISYANRPRKTIVEVLEDFQHATAKLTLTLLFELFQPIKPRPFSICSSVLSNRLDLLIAVVEYKTRIPKPRRGLCSSWIKTLNPGDRVRVTIKNGTMKIPQETDRPFVMVGPGTGIAIFRSIIQHTDLSGENRDLTLFFGCRNKEKDFHCRELLEKMEAGGKLRLHCAFSRDEEDKMLVDQVKTICNLILIKLIHFSYVQHLIKRQAELLRKLIVQQGGYFFVSGSSKDMPQAVREALEESLNEKDYVEQMIKSGRYQEETW